MKNAIIAFAAVMALGVSSHAAVLKLQPGSKSNNGVNVSHGGTAIVDGKSYDLTTVGAGLRTKKVLVAKVKVYVGQLLVSSPERFVRKDKEALRSLEDSETVAMQLTFLRSVEADKVKVSFRDALSANKVNLNSPAIKALLSAVNNGGDADANGTLTFVSHKNSDGSEVLIYEDTRGKQVKISGEKGLTHDVFSMWLGVPSDDGVASFKDSVIHSQD